MIAENFSLERVRLEVKLNSPDSLSRHLTILMTSQNKELDANEKWNSGKDVDGFYGKKFDLLDNHYDHNQIIIKSATSSTTSARFCSSLSAWCDCRPPDLDNLMFHIFTALK